MKRETRCRGFRRITITIGMLMVSDATWASDDAMTCVKEIAIPTAYSSIAARIPATVEARILVGEHGKAEKVAYDTNIQTLTLYLDGYFKEKTKYLDSCKGRTISLTVQFIMIEPEFDSPYSEVHFEPPDRFLVICHRLKPSLDPARPITSK